MRHYPATRGPVCLQGVEIRRSFIDERPLSACGRCVWFLLGFFTAGTIAGFLSGLLPC